MSEEFFDYEAQEPKNNLIAFLLIAACLFLVATFILLFCSASLVEVNIQDKRIKVATKKRHAAISKNAIRLFFGSCAS